jgi:flagellar assembly protein FliH
MSIRLIKAAEGSELDLQPFVVQGLPEGLMHLQMASAAGAGSDSAQRIHNHVGQMYSHQAETQPSPEELLAAAQNQAEQIIAAAEARKAEIEHTVRAELELAANQRLEAELAQAMDGVRSELEQTLLQLANLAKEIVMRSERDLVKLALEIAKKVVHREVTVDRDVVMTLAHVALARLHGRAVATVHLHPEDFRYVSANRERLNGGAAIELIEDRSVGMGGCIIETAMGDIDARIEQQFLEIEKGLLAG